MTKANGKHALVTGANKGIGLAVVRGLAKEGFTAWLGARDRARGEAAAAALRDEGAGDVRSLSLDVTDDASVKKAAEELSGASKSLDVLVNNAAALLQTDGPASSATVAAVRDTYDVNVLGPLRVTQAFLPLLREAAAARIVMVSSGLGSLTLLRDPASGLSQWPVFAYSSSKTALNAMTIYFANELSGTSIKVNTVSPGFVKTDLNNNTGTLTPDEGAVEVLRAALLDAEGPTGAFFGRGATLPW